MPKKEKILQLFVAFLVGILLVGCVFLSVSLQKMEEAWGNELATLIATDDSIRAFGDGAHTIPITPEDSLKIGEIDTVFDIEITVNDAGFVGAIKNSYPESEYWFVEFTVRNISDQVQYGINPKVDAQLQYLLPESNFYSREYEDPERSKCNSQTTSEGFDSSASIHCHFVYVVPSGESSLYWIYARTATGADNSYEERYVSFQIR